jgi:putative colanic acid biosynthesis UDP-glucose lipid carrier transferase
MSHVGLIRSPQSTIGIIQRISDAGLLLGTLWLSVWLSGYPWSDRYSIAALGGVLLYYFLAEMNGLYASWRSSASLSWELKLVAWSWFWVVQAFLLATFVAKVSAEYSRQAMLTWFFLGPAAIVLWRWSFQVLLKNPQHFGINLRRVAIAGAGDLGKRLAQTIRTHSGMGLSIIGFYDDKLERDSLVESVPVRGNLETLIENGKNGQMDCVYIALPMSAETRIKELLSCLADTAVTVHMIPDFFVFELLHSQWQNIGGLPVISIYGSPLHGVGGMLKRIEDVILSLFILVIIAIPMFIIALGVKLTSPGPILFIQQTCPLISSPLENTRG